jgi:hypothetical protein
MSVMSVGQRPGATGLDDETGGVAGRARTGQPGPRALPGRPGGRALSGCEPYPLSRLERELRSRRTLARELRAHETLTRELRARGSVAGKLRVAGELRESGQRGRARGLAARRPGHGVRLTRRGRCVVVGFVVGVVLAVVAALWLAAATGAQAANHGAAAGTVYKSMMPVVVQPGQTLWAIALRAEPTADPRVVISQIMEFNALGSDVVVPGERLWVPRG